MASLARANEAAEHSKAHQKWIVATLAANGGSCSYGELVEVGEEHQCDTVGAMLKILKNRKIIKYKPMFLMFPMHSAETVTLIGDAPPADAATDSPSNGAAASAPPATAAMETSVPAVVPASRMPQFTSGRGLEQLEISAAALKIEPSRTETSSSASAEPTREPVASKSDESEEPVASASGSYSLEQLQSPAPYPAGINTSQRETYLDDTTFEQVFGMSKADFTALAKWKQSNLKKKHKLF